ncbi:MAG: DEAD/DEAH box helicase [Dactylosporangium sp.]|nr:DEAD/DEAH box helicase [Dactylosporangium sp.]
MLKYLLAERPGQNKRELLAGLRRLGLPVSSTRDVNRTLYASRKSFVHDGATPPRWYLVASKQHVGAATASALAPPLPRSYRGKEPRAWQKEAFAEWRARRRRAVVEAVTGTGKTTVGVLAAAAALDSGEKVLVLVPGRELLHQWHDVLQRDLFVARVGRLGARHADSLRDHSIVVATVQSAAERPYMLPPGASGLLVADEVHRYGAPHYARALHSGFGARLGLTATYERSDNGLIEHVGPYFGSVVTGCSYDRALAENILAPVRVGFVEVEFTADERAEYDEYNRRAKLLRSRLIEDYGCPEAPFGEFMAAVKRLERDRWAPGAQDARHYLTAFQGRSHLLADCEGKLQALAKSAPVLAAADRGLVFSETHASAERGASVLRANGVQAVDFTSRLRGERKERMAAFKDGRVRVLTTARLLDEGVDIPQADVGVIMAGSHSKRQMIQRMGRIIRPKTDRRAATFIILYARGTVEDPANGAHEDFREELTEVAEDIRCFDGDAWAADLLAWYYEGRMIRPARATCGTRPFRTSPSTR